MRTFEERKDEILRRSENRIRRRKTVYSHAAALCIPLVLTAAILLLPKADGSEPLPDMITTSPTGTRQPHQALGTDATVTVSKAGYILIHEDETAVDAILTALESVVRREPMTNLQDFGTAEDFQTESASLRWCITVTQDEVKTVYTLQDDCLTDDNANTWKLSANEMQTLKKLLGLPPS